MTSHFKNKVIQPYFWGSSRQSTHRFQSILAIALLCHLSLFLFVNAPANNPSTLKKMTASLFEVATSPASSSSIRVKLNRSEPEKVSDASPPIVLPKRASSAALKPSQKAIPAQKTIHKPLRKRTVSAASYKTKDEAYLARWQNYIEQFGNDHYPAEVLKQRLQGELRLLVAIKQDGSLHEVSLRKSSGSAVLDQAAIQIVLAGAPYEPLPADLAEDIEVLEIIRTWQFQGRLRTT